MVLPAGMAGMAGPGWPGWGMCSPSEWDLHLLRMALTALRLPRLQTPAGPAERRYGLGSQIRNPGRALRRWRSLRAPSALLVVPAAICAG